MRRTDWMHASMLLGCIGNVRGARATEETGFLGIAYGELRKESTVPMGAIVCLLSLVA